MFGFVIPVKFGFVYNAKVPFEPQLFNPDKSICPYKLSLSKVKFVIFLKLLPLISIVLIALSEVNPVYIIELPAVCVIELPLSNFQETRLDPELNVMVGSKEDVAPLF